jgi:hypothetical protein
MEMERMNLAAYLATPVKTLNAYYSAEVEKARVAPVAIKKARVETEELNAHRQKTWDELSNKVKAVTFAQFQAIDLRMAFDYNSSQASAMCAKFVKFGYARIVGKTAGTRRKPAFIYEWLTK